MRSMRREGCEKRTCGSISSIRAARIGLSAMVRCSTGPSDGYGAQAAHLWSRSVFNPEMREALRQRLRSMAPNDRCTERFQFYAVGRDPRDADETGRGSVALDS